MLKNYFNVIKSIVFECQNWYLIILVKFFNLKLKYIKLRNKLKIFIGSRLGKADLSMFMEVFHDKSYNPKGFEIKEDDIVFDIGANNGFFTLFAASKATKGAVYAFEPVASLIQKIEKSISLNNFKNVTIENMAIGTNNSSNVFYISKEHNGCHSLYKRNGELEEIVIKSINLQKYCEDKKITKIDFLKLDCEGAEYEILNGDSISFIKNTVDKISMEYHDDINEHTHVEILEILTSVGFITNIIGGYIYAKNGNR